MEGSFDFLGASPSRFVKIKFDGNIRNGRDGTDYVIQDLEAKLLAVRSLHLFEPFVLKIELRAAWMSIICATLFLNLIKIACPQLEIAVTHVHTLLRSMHGNQRQKSDVQMLTRANACL